MTGPRQAACRDKQFEHPQLLQFTPSLLLQAPDPLSETVTKSWGQQKLQSPPGSVCQGPWVSTQCSYSQAAEIKVACAAEVLSSLPFHPGITGKCRSGETPGGQLSQSATRTTWRFFRWAQDDALFQTWVRLEAGRETLQPPHGFLWRSHSLSHKSHKTEMAAELPLLRAFGGSLKYLPQATCTHEVVKGAPHVQEHYWLWGVIHDWLTYWDYIESLLYTALRREFQWFLPQKSWKCGVSTASKVVLEAITSPQLCTAPFKHKWLLFYPQWGTLWRVCVVCRGK